MGLVLPIHQRVGQLVPFLSWT